MLREERVDGELEVRENLARGAPGVPQSWVNRSWSLGVLGDVRGAPMHSRSGFVAGAPLSRRSSAAASGAKRGVDVVCAAAVWQGDCAAWLWGFSVDWKK